MLRVWPFRRSRADEDGEKLLSAVVQVSRQPGFFGPDRAPDTLEGRLEIMTLHASLALIRLQADPGLAPLAQAFTDQLFRHLDAGLREAGVGDLAVPKRMHKIAGKFYGRLEAYSQAIAAQDEAALAAALSRNVLADEGAPPFAHKLASHVTGLAAAQAAAPADALFRLDGWAAAPG